MQTTEHQCLDIALVQMWPLCPSLAPGTLSASEYLLWAAQGQGFSSVGIQVGKLLVSLPHGFYLHKCKHSDIGKTNSNLEIVGGKPTELKKKNSKILMTVL